MNKRERLSSAESSLDSKVYEVHPEAVPVKASSQERIAHVTCIEGKQQCFTLEWNRGITSSLYLYRDDFLLYRKLLSCKVKNRSARKIAGLHA